MSNGDKACKRRRVHMDLSACFSYSNSKTGALPLISPHSTAVIHQRPNVNPNHGLFPRQRLKKPFNNSRNNTNHLPHQDTVTMDGDLESKAIPSTSRAASVSGFKRASELPTHCAQALLSDDTIFPTKKLKTERCTQASNLTNYFTVQRSLHKTATTQKDPPQSSFDSDDVAIVFDSSEQLKKHPEISDPLGFLDSTAINVDDEHLTFSLPEHIMENIFVRLPILDLLLNQTRVCTHWNNIIRNENFIPWKKNYYYLKHNRSVIKDRIRMICASNNMNTVHDCIFGLIKYMKNFNHKPSPDMLSCLRLHNKYQWAEDLLRERYPECFAPDPNPWCVITTLVILASSVEEIYYILRLCEYHRYMCHVPDVLECFYCIATFLLHFKDAYGINHGFHYRLYYVLYLYENQSSCYLENLTALKQSSSGQQNILKYAQMEKPLRLTHEQMRIVNHKLKPGEVVKIVAFAGTGKTTTLLEYTKLRPGMKFLNIMYNKSVCDHAKSLFPKNVECRTAHSLAYTAVGFRYRSKLVTKIRPLDIQEQVLHRRTTMLPPTVYANVVLKTIEAYVASADTDIALQHVPVTAIYGSATMEIALNDKNAILEDVKNIWRKMTDPKDFTMHVTHDTYLKLYQLNKPRIENFNCILVDEGQDCSMPILDVVLTQNCPKIIVGDPHQQIYSFRGAINALCKVPASSVYYLTQSFRFGPEVAYIANCALEVLKNVKDKTLVGGKQASYVTGRREGQLAIIARSNVVLFNEAVNICCLHHDPTSSDVRGAFVGGLSSYHFDQLLDIYTLFSGGNPADIKNRFIARFKSFNSLLTYARHAEDIELQERTRLVRMHRENIIGYIKKIKERCKFSCSSANVIFTTAHKSKGLEFDTVRIMDDFSIGFVPPRLNSLRSHPADEYNLLYVAITRAKKSLIMSQIVYYMLLWAEEKFQYLSLPKPSVSLSSPNGKTVQCATCHEKFALSNALTLYQLPLSLADGRTINGGSMCLPCATSPVFLPTFPHPEEPTSAIRIFEDVTHSCLFRLIGPIGQPIPKKDNNPRNLGLVHHEVIGPNWLGLGFI